MFMNKRVDYRYWLMCASRESPMIPICSAYKMGWSSPVNLAIYRRSTWRLITEDRKLP
jgi:hypothetical protein